MAQSIQDLVDVARSHEVAARRAEMDAHQNGLEPGARFQSWNPHAQAAFNANAAALDAENKAWSEWNRTKKSPAR